MATVEEFKAAAPQIQWVVDEAGRIAAVIDDMEIMDPCVSTCGRFTVDPMREYGIPWNVAARLIAHNSQIDFPWASESGHDHD